jgi:hypothetical protein
MARNIVVTLDGEESSFDFKAIDRAAIYGRRRRVVAVKRGWSSPVPCKPLQCSRREDIVNGSSSKSCKPATASSVARPLPRGHTVDTIQ